MTEVTLAELENRIKMCEIKITAYDSSIHFFKQWIEHTYVSELKEIRSFNRRLDTLLKDKPYIDSVIFMVCDQPHVSLSILNELIRTQQRTTKQIVTCNYGDSIGPPALFHKKYFRELMKLSGDSGARKIIEQNMNDVATILFPEGKIDIDTKEDYDKLTGLSG